MEHSGETVVRTALLCAKFQNNTVPETDVVD